MSSLDWGFVTNAHQAGQGLWGPSFRRVHSTLQEFVAKRASVQQMSVQPPQPAKGVSGVKLGMFYKSFPTGSLEKEIIDSTVPIIGVSFIFKEIYYNQMTFSCQLCQMSRINQENMLTHLKSYEHTNRYVEVKFQEKLTKAELKVRRKEIMELEGKLHHPIKDFSSHLPLELQCGSSLSSLCEDVADVSLHSKSRTCLSVCTSLPVDTTLTDKQKQRAKSFPPKLLKFITEDEMRQARRMMLCKWLLDCARQDGNDHNVVSIIPLHHNVVCIIPSIIMWDFVVVIK
ncbi:uncharacterized protein [Procambarus clarkii]|uniref:uncharacterized protein n=1 Tax=Procambarus clarkii TaxID=6728 RepID=UPI003742F15D